MASQIKECISGLFTFPYYTVKGRPGFGFLANNHSGTIIVCVHFADMLKNSFFDDLHNDLFKGGEETSDFTEWSTLVFKKNSIVNESRAVVDNKCVVDFLIRDHPSEVNEKEYLVLILLDRKLPKLNGHDLIERIISHILMIEISVRILTSCQQEQDMRRGYELGENGYVRKPVAARDFLNSVNHQGVSLL